MIKKFNDFLNESVRDEMTPKSEKDIIHLFQNKTPNYEYMQGIELGMDCLIKDALKRGANIDKLIDEIENGAKKIKQKYNIDIELRSNKKFIDFRDGNLFFGTYSLRKEEFVLFTYDPNEACSDMALIPPEIRIPGDFFDKIDEFYNKYKSIPRTTFAEYNDKMRKRI